MKPLSPREREVLLWTARGKSADEIAMILATTHCAVRSQRDRARQKLGAVNTAQSVVKAIAAGELSLSEAAA